MEWNISQAIFLADEVCLVLEAISPSLAVGVAETEEGHHSNLFVLLGCVSSSTAPDSSCTRSRCCYRSGTAEPADRGGEWGSALSQSRWASFIWSHVLLQRLGQHLNAFPSCLARGEWEAFLPNKILQRHTKLKGHEQERVESKYSGAGELNLLLTRNSLLLFAVVAMPKKARVGC